MEVEAAATARRRHRHPARAGRPVRVRRHRGAARRATSSRPPTDEAALLAKAERDCFVGASLTAKPPRTSGASREAAPDRRPEVRRPRPDRGRSRPRPRGDDLQPRPDERRTPSPRSRSCTATADGGLAVARRAAPGTPSSTPPATSRALVRESAAAPRGLGRPLRLRLVDLVLRRLPRAAGRDATPRAARRGKPADRLLEDYSNYGALKALCEQEAERGLRRPSGPRPTRSDRRAERPDRPLHVLAAPGRARRPDARPARPARPDDRRPRPRRLDDPAARGRAQRPLQRDLAAQRASASTRCSRRAARSDVVWVTRAVPRRTGRRGLERPTLLDPVHRDRPRLLPARPGRPRCRCRAHLPAARRDRSRRPRVDGEGGADRGARARTARRVGEDDRVSLDVAAVRARFTALQRDLVFFDAPRRLAGAGRGDRRDLDLLPQSNANTSGPYETSRRTEALDARARETPLASSAAHPTRPSSART